MGIHATEKKVPLFIAEFTQKGMNCSNLTA